MKSVAALTVVSLVTLQLKVGLYSKSIVYTAKPTRGTSEKFRLKLKE